MKFFKVLSYITLATLMGLPGMVNAVSLPYLDIQNLTGDTGVTLTATSLDIDATVTSIITTGGPVNIDNEIFSLTTSAGSYNDLAGTGSFSGSFTVGSLLSGTFTDITVASLTIGNALSFGGEVTFTGGSLMGPTLGSIDGTIGDIFGDPARSSDVVAKLGAVVPIPAAAWLFGSGLIGLVAVARRKTIAA